MIMVISINLKFFPSPHLSLFSFKFSQFQKQDLLPLMGCNYKVFPFWSSRSICYSFYENKFFVVLFLLKEGNKILPWQQISEFQKILKTVLSCFMNFFFKNCFLKIVIKLIFSKTIFSFLKLIIHK